MRLPLSNRMPYDANGNALYSGTLGFDLDTEHVKKEDAGEDQEYELEDQFDRLNLHAKDGDDADDEELEAFGGTKRRLQSGNPPKNSEVEGVKTRRHNRQADIRPPPAERIQAHLNSLNMPAHSTANQMLSGMPASNQCLAHSARNVKSVNSLSPKVTAGSESRGQAPGSGKASLNKSQKGNAFQFSVAIQEGPSRQVMLTAGQSPTHSRDLPVDVDCDGAPAHSEEARVAIEKIKESLMAWQPPCSPAASLLPGTPSAPRGHPHLIGEGSALCPEGNDRFANIVNGQLCFQPSGPPVNARRAVPPLSTLGSRPAFSVATASVAGTVAADPAVCQRAGPAVSGPPSLSLVRPLRLSCDVSPASSPASSTGACLRSAHGGSNSSISSSCSGNEINSQAMNARYPPSLPDAHSNPTHLISGSTFGGSVTRLSPGILTPPTEVSFSFSNSGSPAKDSGRGSLDSSPASTSTHGTSCPTSPDSGLQQRSPRGCCFPPTPLSSDGDCFSPRPGSCQSPGSVTVATAAAIPTRLQPNSPRSHTAMATTQSPQRQRAEHSPRNCSVESPQEIAHDSTLVTLGSPLEQLESTPRTCMLGSPEAGAQHSALVSQSPDNFLSIGGESCTEGTNGGQGIETEAELETSLEYSQDALLPAEVLDAMCDEKGVWLEDSEGDTFLHSLSGWENEGAAVENLLHLRDKPGFRYALNKHNKSSETPLYNALCMGRVKLVEAMIHLGANINSQCCFEMQAHTPLHKAVELGNTAMVEVLVCSTQYIDIGAQRSSDGCTALMLALLKHIPHHPVHDRLKIIQLLVDEDEKQNLKVKDHRSGKTALMLAVETKDIRVVDLILEEVGVDGARELINIPNRAGNTAVHLAAGLRCGGREIAVQEQILSKLIKFGGDTTKKNNEGDSPKDWARNMIDKVARLR